jgi:hypothetical protein
MRLREDQAGQAVADRHRGYHERGAEDQRDRYERRTRRDSGPHRGGNEHQAQDAADQRIPPPSTRDRQCGAQRRQYDQSGDRPRDNRDWISSSLVSSVPDS